MPTSPERRGSHLGPHARALRAQGPAEPGQCTGPGNEGPAVEAVYQHARHREGSRCVGEQGEEGRVRVQSSNDPEYQGIGRRHTRTRTLALQTRNCKMMF
ncbi:hypothetical protein PVAG01_02343 [Phlyctema vagabunda]|uniref:Uncharacterized protein n=1 Tax=Phlyctema vagabunda TaxID=108571 RepID=A0ABR4PQD1_9HELO